MSILSDFEDRISGVVEGGFARLFRSPVQPAELARKLGREMDRRKVVSVGKVFAPTLYNVLLSQEDDAALGGFANTLAGELETYLVGYARERSYALATRPVVRFIVDPDLKLGRFDVIGELLSPEEMAEELGDDVADHVAPGGPASGQQPSAPIPVTPVIAPVVRPGLLYDAEAEEPGFSAGGEAGGTAADGSESAQEHYHRPLATITVRGVDHDVVLRGERMVVGRLNSCDVCLSDSNASRQHSAFVPEGAGWAVEDLGSTNGTWVNGQRIDRLRLRDGDVIVVGVTELVYHEPRS